MADELPELLAEVRRIAAEATRKALVTGTWEEFFRAFPSEQEDA